MASDLEFRIGAEFTEIKGALAQLRKDFASVGAAAQQAGNAGKSLGNIESSIVGAVRAAKGLVAAFAAFQGAQALQAAAKAGVEFNSQLEGANSAIASLIFAQSKLAESQGRAIDGAEGLKVAYGLAADQVQKLRIAGLETAATSTQLVEAFQSAVGPGIAAGLGLDEIRTLTIQITQAAGALNVPFDQLSQEIRSILDGSIDVNSRVAKTLGISNDQVKNWQTQGKLVQELSARLAPFEEAGKAAANNFSVIASNAKEAVDTLGGEAFRGFFDELKKGLSDATSGLFDTKNLAVTSELRDAVEFAQELAASLGGVLADALRGVVSLAQDFSAYVKENRDELEGIKTAVAFVAQQFGKIIVAVASIVGGVSDAGVKLRVFQGIMLAVGLLVAGIRDGFRVITAAVVGLGSVIIKAVLLPFEALLWTAKKVAEFLGKGDLAGFFDDVHTRVQQISTDGISAANDLLKPIADGKGAVAGAVDDLEKLADAAVKAESATKKAVSAASDPGGKVTGLRNPPKIPGPDQAQLAKADADRMLAVLEQGYKDGNIATAEYYAERGRLQAAAIDAEIREEEVKRSRLQKSDENGQREAATRLALLQKKKIAAAEDNAAEELRAARELRAQLSELEAKDLENQGKLGQAASIRAAEQFRELRNRLVLAGDEKGVGLIDRLIDTDKAKARFDQIKAEFDRVTQRMQSEQQQIANARDTGAIAPDTAQQQAIESRQRALTDLQALNAEIQKIAADPNALPAVKQAATDAALALDNLALQSMTGVDAAVVQLNASLANMSASLEQSVVNAGVSSLEGFFTNLASGSMSAADALKGFVASFVSSMAQIAARALATYAVLQLLEAIFPGAGRIVAASGGGIGVGKNHRGGMAGQGHPVTVNPLVFAGAPRYHSGGMVGLKPDERPAILQTGEEVLARNDPRNRANAGGAGGNGYRIVNVLDPSLVSGYLESAQGERSVLNVISRNPALVRQTIGA